MASPASAVAPSVSVGDEKPVRIRTVRVRVVESSAPASKKRELEFKANRFSTSDQKAYFARTFSASVRP